MPIPAYGEFKDSSGNKIPGSVKRAGREKMCEVQEFDHPIRIPTDNKSGGVTGVRQHKPVEIVIPYDEAIPPLFQALCDGETLKEVCFRWYRINDNGKEEKYFRHLLEEVKISKMRAFMPNTKNPKKEQFTHLVRVALLYQKISWWCVDGNKEFSDSWTGEGTAASAA